MFHKVQCLVLCADLEHGNFLPQTRVLKQASVMRAFSTRNVVTPSVSCTVTSKIPPVLLSRPWSKHPPNTAGYLSC